MPHNITYATLEKQEVDSLELIQIKISCSKQALQIVPYTSNNVEKKFYYQSVLDSYCNYKWLEQDWWKSIIAKYNIHTNSKIYLDYITREIYG